MLVIYNGGKNSYYGCSSPDLLVAGRIYEVISKNVKHWQTDYCLRGVPGDFNSVWFDELPEKPVFFVTSHLEPQVGSELSCLKPTSNKGMKNWITTPVLDVTLVGRDTFKATTKNSIYIVTVL